MSLKKLVTLLLVLALILSVIPMAAASTEPTSEDAPEEPVKEEKGIPWAYTALILALVTTFLQNKFIHGRR